MKGDFSRLTFRPEKHYSSVRMQQGRVQVDADWNEAMDITEHRQVVQTIDVIGLTGAPMGNAAFGIVVSDTQLSEADRKRLSQRKMLPSQLKAGDFLLTPGRFYVDGMLCEVDDFVPFTLQPDLPGLGPLDNRFISLIYLDVWQRHITALEDPAIREAALGGPDTTTRIKSVWQVKALPAVSLREANLAVDCSTPLPAWDSLIAPSTGRLSARAQPGEQPTDPCLVPAGAGYRRLENQLYRVEIHAVSSDGTVSFKWSRDNGSVLAQVSAVLAGNQLQVSSLGHDTVSGFAAGQWIELVDERHELLGTPGDFARISSADAQVLTLDRTLSGYDANTLRVRRWDFSDAGGPPAITFAAANGGFIPLESGVEVKFEPGTYKPGDYWLIPARTLTGVEWPYTEPQLPAGVQHHYCRLGLVRHNVVRKPGQQAATAAGPGVQTQAAPVLSQAFDQAMPLGTYVASGAAPILSQAFDHVSAPQSASSLAAEGVGAADVSQISAPAAAATPVAQPAAAGAVAPRAVLTPVRLLVLADCRVLFPPLGAPGVRVLDVQVQTPPKSEVVPALTSVRNDDQVLLSNFGELHLLVDQEVDGAGLAGKPTCTLTVQTPFPLLEMYLADKLGQSTNITKVPSLGTRPLVLAGDASSAGMTIVWKPGSEVVQALYFILQLMQRYAGVEKPRLLTQLEVKGNFIAAKTEPDRYLDGDTFGGAQLPSGDGRRGGDFRCWFWLVLPQTTAVQSNR